VLTPAGKPHSGKSDRDAFPSNDADKAAKAPVKAA
jgi:hypothetical protein